VLVSFRFTGLWVRAQREPVAS